MSFENKYLKYKEKYLALKKTLEMSGIKVEKNNSEFDFTIQRSDLSEMVLTNTPTDNISRKTIVNNNEDVSDLVLSDTPVDQQLGGGEHGNEHGMDHGMDHGNEHPNEDFESEYDLTDTPMYDEYTGGADSQPAEVSLPNSIPNATNCSSVNLQPSVVVPSPSVTVPVEVQPVVVPSGLATSADAVPVDAQTSAQLSNKNLHNNEEMEYTTTEVPLTEHSDIDMLLGQLGGKGSDPYDFSDSISSLFDSSSSPEDFSDFDSSLSLSDLN